VSLSASRCDSPPRAQGGSHSPSTRVVLQPSGGCRRWRCRPLVAAATPPTQTDSYVVGWWCDRGSNIQKNFLKGITAATNFTHHQVTSRPR